MLRGLGVGVHDGAPTDLVGVAEVFEVLVGHVCGRVVDAPDLALLADLDFRGDRMDRAGGVVDVADRSGRGHGLQVLVVDAVAQDRVTQFRPVTRRGDMDAAIGEQLPDAFGARLQRPTAVGVLVEVVAFAGRLGVVRRGERGERAPALHGQGVRCPVGVVGHGHEIHVGEVQRLLAAVLDAFAGQEPVQVHLPQTDRMPFLVGAQHRRHAGHRGLFGHGGQRANRGAHGGAQVGVHRLGDVQRAEVAGHIAPDVLVAQILTERARLLHLQDLRTQIGHHHTPLDRVRPVDRVLEYQVGVAGFELQLGQRHEELPSVDPGLADALVGHHAIVFLGHADVGERFAVHPFHIVGAEQRHPFLAFGQFERDVRHHHAQRQRFDADLLVGILAFGV